ncbi:Disease resistance-like protein DSC1, partial [Camellia lanceoleosa]
GTKTIEGLILDLPELKEDMRTKHANNAQPHFEDFPGKSTMIFEGSSSKRRRLGFLSWLPINSSLMESDEAVLETDAFSPMLKLRILQLYNVPLSGGYDEFPKKLRWLCWHGFPLTFIPNDFPLENMVVLDLPHSSLRQFCKGTK